MRLPLVLGVAFALGAALTVLGVRAWDLFHESLDNALRLGRA